MKYSPYINPVFIISAFIFSLIAAALLNIDMFVSYLLSNNEIVNGFFNERFTDKSQEVASYLSGLFSPNIATLIIWAIIGTVCYCLMSVLTNESGNLRNIVLVFQPYVRPRDFELKRYLVQFAQDLVFKLILSAILITWIYLLFMQVLPTISRWIAAGLFNASGSSIMDTTQLILSPLLLFSWILILGAIVVAAREAGKKIGF